MKKHFYLFALIIMAICSCSKDDPSASPNKYGPGLSATYPLDTSMAHYKFNVGSYWVYKNDTTSVLDSIVVDSISDKYPFYDGGASTEFTYTECFEMKMHSFLTLQYYRDDLVFFNLIYRNIGSNLKGFPGGTAMYKSNSDTGTVVDAMKILNKYPSITLNGNSFNNVDESKITAALQTQQNFAHDTYLFYTPSVGLIKKEEDLGGGNIQSWSILRWHVVR